MRIKTSAVWILYDQLQPLNAKLVIDDNKCYQCLISIDFHIIMLFFLSDAREQTNEATSYIDGSQIYGSDETGAKYLRQFKKGNLKGRLSTDGRWLLPISSDPKDGCNQPEEVRHSRYCFRAGIRIFDSVS